MPTDPRVSVTITTTGPDGRRRPARRASDCPVSGTNVYGEDVQAFGHDLISHAEYLAQILRVASNGRLTLTVALNANPGEAAKDRAGTLGWGQAQEELARIHGEPELAEALARSEAVAADLTPAQYDEGWRAWRSPAGVLHIVPPPGAGACATCGRGRHSIEEGQ
jgi:hypothetical protein